MPTQYSPVSDAGQAGTADGAELIAARGVTKRFGVTQALSGVDLDVRSGSIVALLGQNGAGKSTLIKILAGVHTLDEGAVTVCGNPLGSPMAHGLISFIHQDLGLVPGLSVAENIALAAGYPRRGRLIRWAATAAQARRALELIGSEVDPRTQVSELSRTDRSLVAIARALVVDARVLVLDEPTASLPVDETHRLFTVLRRLRDDGMGLIYVSHRIDEVFEIADRVTILRDGLVVTEGPLATMTPDSVVHAIVGSTPVPPPPPVPASGQPVLLDLADVIGERVGPVSLSLRAGEVLGMVGLSGAGQVEIGRTVIGDLPCYGGRMTLAGQPYRASTVRHAVGRGLGLVTSNRADEGLALTLTVTENFRPNLAVPGVRAGHPRWRRLRSNRAERHIATQLAGRFGVRPADPALPVSALSGGNQQKVILGRWLSSDAKVLILEEPTAGVDVGAKRDLYALLDEALARGIGVLLISTDFEEVAHVSHRALVFRDGRIVREIPRDSLTVQALVSHAAGAGS
jgi:ribose transport system ATP-binding protein